MLKTHLKKQQQTNKQIVEDLFFESLKLDDVHEEIENEESEAQTPALPEKMNMYALRQVTWFCSNISKMGRVFSGQNFASKFRK